ncbi:hypothetical protein EMIT0232MI5_180094 [Pseudomonas sp. IT-232MI5]
MHSAIFPECMKFHIVILEFSQFSSARVNHPSISTKAAWCAHFSRGAGTLECTEQRIASRT